ncbi:MAG TPA: YidC/Oxa1 family insertase periplasmic-domain containing protein [Candidatus Sumerlaeota bacterium]|nr:YidC/Oxa1 family insertase periplasmic-domain containing protein [Candidatus Sumerlaeota bacterium]HPS02718.1 YidC/Oxa1 family insertase periplasmic-domain containing protein [Candidatus Sumerlaeota bacterium]
MDDNSKRLLFFILVSMPLLFFYQSSLAKKQRAEKAKTEATRLAEAQQNPAASVSPDGVQTTSGATSLTQSLMALGQEFSSGTLAQEKGSEIVVDTKTYHIVFDTAGAHPTQWQIVDPEFAKVVQADIDAAHKANQAEIPKIRDFRPIDIIPQYKDIEKDQDYPFMVVLNQNGRYVDALNRRVYKVDGPRTVAGDAGTSESVVLTFTSPAVDGIRLVKTFRFPVNGYLANVEMKVENVATQTAAFTENLQPGLGLMWGPGLGSAHLTDPGDSRLFKVAVYDGEKIYSEALSDWQKARKQRVEKEWEAGGKQGWKWAGLDSRFYMAAILPQELTPRVRGLVKGTHVPLDEKVLKTTASPLSAEIYSAPFRLTAGESQTFHYTVFVGPKKRALLVDIDKHHPGYNLSNLMFQSDWWLSQNLIRPVALLMLWLMNWFHALTGNFGVSIILVTIAMRLMTQPFTHMGMKSQARVMAEQARIKPLIDAINEKYKDDPQKRSAETWKTYREHGVNPLGMMKGCVWMMIQIPFFFALYRLLLGAIDLRGEGFLWMTDLTAPDALFTLPFSLPLLGNKLNILPILMGVSQVFAQRLQSNNIQDPTQKQMATIMPIMFTFMLYNFAAGLSLYWFISNIWQIIFQVFVNKKVKEEAERKVHLAFEQRQKAAQGVGGKPIVLVQKRKATATASGSKPTWQERLTTYIETKAKEAEAIQRAKAEDAPKKKDK